MLHTCIRDVPPYSMTEVITKNEFDLFYDISILEDEAEFIGLINKQGKMENILFKNEINLTSDEKYDVYHKDGNSANYDITNLKAVHVNCHIVNNKKKKDNPVKTDSYMSRTQLYTRFNRYNNNKLQ